jgi:hypothetical protein
MEKTVLDLSESTAPADARPAGSSIFGLIRMMLLDVGLPLLAYYGLHAVGVSDYRALLAGSVVAGLRVAFVALRNRRLDGFAAFLMSLFAVGLALSFVTGDARFMLAKDSVGTAVAGLIFLGTCVVGRPMMFYAAQRFSATTSEKRAWWNTKWQTSPGFRRGFRVMSVVWGVGLLVEAAVRIPLIYLLPIHVMVGLSTVLQVVAFTLLMVWGGWYGKRMRRSGRAAEAARSAGADEHLVSTGLELVVNVDHTGGDLGVGELGSQPLKAGVGHGRGHRDQREDPQLGAGDPDELENPRVVKGMVEAIGKGKQQM